jgi:hypothetical protein
MIYRVSYNVTPHSFEFADLGDKSELSVEECSVRYLVYTVSGNFCPGGTVIGCVEL